MDNYQTSSFPTFVSNPPNNNNIIPKKKKKWSTEKIVSVCIIIMMLIVIVVMVLAFTGVFDEKNTEINLTPSRLPSPPSNLPVNVTVT